MLHAFLPLLALAFAFCCRPSPAADHLDWIRTSGHHFVADPSGKPIEMWGFNYDRDHSGRLLEDYWDRDWDSVTEDFQEMKALGANVVRIHLQLGRFMDGTNQASQANLQLLANLVSLADKTGLYLDLTGLGCYLKQQVPAWYDSLDESSRWEVQANFWRAVAGVCRNHPAVFCYDLMNEPVIGGEGANGWLAGEPLDGKYYVQKLTLSKRGRTDAEIAAAWVQKLSRAIREIDRRHLITVGVIPWAQVFKGAKPIFYAPEVSPFLDFVSVHFYPKSGNVKEALAVLEAYRIGKPLVIEEIFPLNATVQQTGEFMRQSHPFVGGYLSFYWGKTIEQLTSSSEVADQLTRSWLIYFRGLKGSPAFSRSREETKP